jgi:hypothetical protein
MDIIVNTVMEIFKSIFKSEVNLFIVPVSEVNNNDIKNKND